MPHDPRLEQQLTQALEGDVRFDDGARALYATDASIYRIPPIGVVVPRSVEDVVRAMQIAAEWRIPVLPRGGGTGLAGQTVAAALVIDCSRHLTGVRVDADRLQARVGPGVTLDALNLAAAEAGLMFGPDVATSSRATLGGMIGNNSCGAHSVVFGKTVDHVERLEVVFADGATGVLGPVDPGDPPGGLAGRLTATLRRLVDAHRDEIGARYPALLRRVAGYNLDEFVEPPWNLARIAVGSEGTLAVTTAATVDLVRRPERTALVLLAYDDLFAGFDAVPTLLGHAPAAVELTDRVLLDLARRHPQHRAAAERFAPGRSPGGLFAVELYGESEDDLRRRGERVVAAVADAGHAPAHARHLADPADQAAFWGLRKAGLGILMDRRGDAKPIAFVEDAAVDPARLGTYMREVAQIVAAEGLEAAYYAHASVGVIHVRPMVDLKRAEGVGQLRRVAEAVAGRVAAHGGAMTGEHGDGLARGEFLLPFFGPALVGAFAELKRSVDPEGRMNPGKIVDPPPMDRQLRYGTAYRAAPPPSTFGWAAFGGLDRAIEQCNGNGACRQAGGVMCPSYHATRDEQHVTRGRANLLREAISGRLPGGLDAPAVREALDLCLSCKGCLRECPSSVDMAALKYEVLVEHHRRHGIGLGTRLLAGLPALLDNGWWLGLLTWPLTRLPGARSLIERVTGIDRRRSLPAPRRPAMTRLPAVAGPRDGRPVALFVDTFSNHFEPEIPRAAMAVLAAAGCRVEPIRPGCCGRPGISKGIPGAGQRARGLADRLRPWLDRGYDLVGLEPSCLLTFRDELPRLIGRALGETLRARSFLLEEYLQRLGPLPGLGPVDAPRAWVHGHCHQKALSDVAATVEVLRWIPDLEVALIDSGCCGMAGSFGYEAAHFELSQQIGELRLLPAARAAGPEDLLVAPGTSCRHQLKDGAGRLALHPAELLARSLG